MKKQPEIKISYLEEVVISTDFGNTRRTFNESSIDELAATIKREGLINPITVRPQADGYQLICGERRLRAMIKLKWPSVPCIIRELTDDEAREMQIIENCQREDVHPLEERDAFLELIISGKKPKDISLQIGKSEAYVNTRINLQNLSPDIERYFYENEITFSHALEFSKLTYPDQERVFNKCVQMETGVITDIVSVKELKSYILNNITLNLTNAIFDTKDSKLIEGVPGCHKCPKRAGCNVNLFGETEPDTCFDPTCYQNKKKAHIDRICNGLVKQGKEVLRLSDKYGDNETAIKNGYDGATAQYNLIPEGHKDYDQIDSNSFAVIVDDWIDTRLGTVYNVDFRKKKKTSTKKSSASAEASEDDKAEEANIQSIELLREKIAEKIGQSKINKFPEHIIKLIGLNYWRGLATGDQKLFARTYDMSITENNKTINYKSLGVGNGTQFYVENVAQMEEETFMDFIITVILFCATENMKDVYEDDPEFRYIIQLAESLKIDFEAIKVSIAKSLGVGTNAS